MTARRDVAALAGRRLLIKTLGGAQDSKIPPYLHETSLSSRLGENRAAKERIALQALNQVRRNQTLFLRREQHLHRVRAAAGQERAAGHGDHELRR
jgi:DeoR/GlpR family transcriptional regulator of sugar metabolism